MPRASSTSARGAARSSVPRYPSNIYYNTATRAQQLDEYNYLYLPPSLGGICQNSSTTTCFSQPATWNAVRRQRGVDHPAARARATTRVPHYVHQANLAQDGILYSVLDEVLRRYRSYFKTSIVQPIPGRGRVTARHAGEVGRRQVADRRLPSERQMHVVSNAAADGAGPARRSLRPGHPLRRHDVRLDVARPREERCNLNIRL